MKLWLPNVQRARSRGLFYRTSLIAACAALVGSGVAISGENEIVYQQPPPGVKNEYRYLGNHLVCITKDQPAGLEDLPCLHIGPIALGATVEGVQSLLGGPDHVSRRSNGTEARVYPLTGPGPLLPYFVVEFDGGKANAIQLTGETPTEYSFAGVRLGDRKKVLKEMLGPPSYTKKVAENGAALWSYAPFPISVEVLNGRVYSIRIYSRPS